MLTPLAVACSVGDVAVVEVMCQWARRERVHLDPTAPTSMGAEASTGQANQAANTTEGAAAAVATAAAASAASPWWDAEEMRRDGDQPAFGDPPMIMAVRSRAPLAQKLKMIAALAGHGFSADVRSPIDSWTPLLAAVDLGCAQLVAALVRHGARISADRHLGFTPLHLCCQMGHWQLVPFLVDAMRGQYSRVAAWGPSPQYVSLNSVDAYGRTALDIALLKYFANPLPLAGESSSKSPSVGSERQKAVDILREFIHRSPPDDGGVVCGWELLRVLRFLDTLPTRKAVGAQLLGADWDSRPPSASGPDAGSPGASISDGAQKISKDGDEKPQQQAGPYGDVEEVLQAVRVLVRAGAQTRWLLQDLVSPPPRGVGSGADSPHDGKDIVAAAIGRGPRPERSCKYSPIDLEDMADIATDEVAAS